VCPIRIMLIVVYIFLVVSGGEGNARMVFLISFNFEEPCVQSRSHILFEINLAIDLASCEVKQLNFIASKEVIALRAFASALFVFELFYTTLYSV